MVRIGHRLEGTVNERLVKVDYPSGKVKYYEGMMGHERLVRTELPDGSVRYFTGSKGAEEPARCRRRRAGGPADPAPSGRPQTTAAHMDGQLLAAAPQSPPTQIPP